MVSRIFLTLSLVTSTSALADQCPEPIGQIIRRALEPLEFHNPALDSEGHLISEALVESNDLILDTNIVIARTLSKEGKPLEAHRVSVLAQTNELERRTGGRTFVTDTVINETVENPRLAVSRRVRPKLGRNSPEYKSIMAQLTEANVGSTRGLRDRRIVADALLSSRSGSGIPTFVTADKKVFANLCRLSLKCTLPDRVDPRILAKDGFMLEVRDSLGAIHQLRVQPIVP
ncbi:MAG: hypothetical protein KDD25_09525 [Bdellovibrionales bacterium]|nr:hypothetical protein [Bdellovibrionales bacterium]